MQMIMDQVLHLVQIQVIHPQLHILKPLYIYDNNNNVLGSYNGISITSSTTSVTPTGLNSNATYYIRITTTANDYGPSATFGANSGNSSATTNSQTSLSFNGPSGISTGSITFNIVWNTYTSGRYYVYDNNNNVLGSYNGGSITSSTTTVTANGLSANARYYIVINTDANQYGPSANYGGNSGNSKAVTQPSISVSVSSYSGSGNSVYMYYTTGGSYRAITSISGGGTLDSGNNRVSGLSAGSSYNITFNVDNSDSTLSNSASTGTFTIPNPSTPSISGLVGWYYNNSPGIKISYTAGGNQTSIIAYNNSNGANLGSVSTSATSGEFFIYNLGPNYQYTIYLVAYNNGVSSASSSTSTRYSASTFRRSGVSYSSPVFSNGTYYIDVTVTDIGGNFKDIFAFVTNDNNYWRYNDANISGTGTQTARISGIDKTFNLSLYVWSRNYNEDYGQTYPADATVSVKPYTLTNKVGNTPIENNNSVFCNGSSLNGTTSFTFNPLMNLTTTAGICAGGGLSLIHI